MSLKLLSRARDTCVDGNLAFPSQDLPQAIQDGNDGEGSCTGCHTRGAETDQIRAGNPAQGRSWKCRWKRTFLCFHVYSLNESTNMRAFMYFLY